MLHIPTFYKKPPLQAPNRQMLMWTMLLVALGMLAVALVLTASANPPNTAEMRLLGLVDELREERLTAKRHAAQRELEVAGDAAVPALTVALRSSDATMRRNAADMLGFIASPRSIGALENAMENDAVPNVRRNAAWALGNISSPAPAVALERATVLDSSALVRQTALDSLARLRSRIALSAGIDERLLTAYAASPQHADLIYAATKRDLLVTVNGGATWKRLPATLPSLTNVLAVSPTDPRIIYAGVDGLGMFKSVNGGLDWESINQGLKVTPGTRFLITAATIDPVDPQRIVIATGIMLGTSNVDFYATGMHLSTDGGTTWHAIQADSPTEPFTKLAVKGAQVYALAGSRVLISRLN